jgi:hypothetical protein
LLPTDRIEEFSNRLSAIPVKVRTGRKVELAKGTKKSVIGLRNPEGRAL